ncbi:MAG: biopolymer transporter ExbD [Verrucomicrobiae bacterium]|nr:biopolymer transporter ExbD [Verrucomicrobiae bacterium]
MTIPSPSRRLRARIEIIPLIDIMFFLLATFMMVSVSMVKNLGMPVNLPKAATATPQERKNSASVTISADGSFFFDREPVTAEQLRHRLVAFKMRHADPRIFINADDQARFGGAIAVLDQIRELGIARVAVQTQRRPENVSTP